MILFEAFSSHGSKEDIPLLHELNRWLELSTVEPVVERMLIQLSTHFQTIPSKRNLVSAEKLFLNRKTGTLSLPAPDKNPTANERYQAALASVERFYKTLSEKVIGQEDILNSLRSLFISDLLINGQRKEPEVFYFLGLPGNGKDTIAEAYVDALWNLKDAHLKHMFRMNIRTKAEAWTYFGSAKGYIGSTELPDLLKFLVEHSGGRYKLGQEVVNRETRTIVEYNKDWKPDDFSFQDPPHKAVIFVNEAHNIPRSVKDNVLKQAIERGIFPITNPGSTPDSVREIILPVTFIFASNEGISLLEPREKNGSRLGAPLTYKRLLENYEHVYKDKALLKQTILNANGERNDTSQPDQPGTSEEFLNRVPDHHIHILKPLSPENLVLIARLLVKNESDRLKSAQGRLGQFEVTLTDEMLKFITEYDMIPSENSRPIKARIKSFVFDELYRAIQEKDIRPSSGRQDILVDIVTNADGSRSVIFNVKSGNTNYQFTKLLEQTMKDVAKEPLSQQRIQEILAMREQILKNVFGVEHIVDRLIEAAIVSESESRNSGESQRPATVMAFLGKTSTGKTETAKQYVKARYGSSERLEVIDFNGVRDLDAMKAKILGSFDPRNNPIPSDFMKAYDRAPDGNIAFIFDEAANSPRELLKALYEILREAVATGFSDGKPRPMKNVTIIITGNAGEKIYDLLPRNLPSDVYERAMHEVFRIFLNNPDLQQRILTETFPDAFIARLGNNIYHFGPLKNSGKRQVAQLKLLKGIENLREKKSESGWNIVFSTESDILELFDLIEREGFNSAYQGASIDSFVRLSIIDKIKAKLLSESVQSGQQILLELNPTPIVRKDRDVSYQFREMKLITPQGKEYSIEIPISKKLEGTMVHDSDRILTAYHEVGHEIVSEVYFGDRVRPKYMSIIEGVTLIGASFVHYAGIRVGAPLSHSPRTKQVVLREAAVLFGGYIAQQLVTIGARHDAGKKNDMYRATQLIQNAILRDGLSDEWGKRSIPEDINTEDYIDKELSQEEKAKLNRITDRWLGYAEQLAKDALYVNIDKLFVEFGKSLSERGYMDEKEILDLHEAYEPITERSPEYIERVDEVRAALEIVDQIFKDSSEDLQKMFHSQAYTVDDAEKAYNMMTRKSVSWAGWAKTFYQSPWKNLTPLQQSVAASYIGNKVRDQSRDARIAGKHWLPQVVANIDKIIEQERLSETWPVTDLSRFEVIDRSEVVEEDIETLKPQTPPPEEMYKTQTMSCKDIF